MMQNKLRISVLVLLCGIFFTGCKKNSIVSCDEYDYISYKYINNTGNDLTLEMYNHHDTVYASFFIENGTVFMLCENTPSHPVTCSPNPTSSSKTKMIALRFPNDSCYWDRDYLLLRKNKADNFDENTFTCGQVDVVTLEWIFTKEMYDLKESCK